MASGSEYGEPPSIASLMATFHVDATVHGCAGSRRATRSLDCSRSHGAVGATYVVPKNPGYTIRPSTALEARPNAASSLWSEPLYERSNRACAVPPSAPASAAPAPSEPPSTPASALSPASVPVPAEASPPASRLDVSDASSLVHAETDA